MYKELGVDDESHRYLMNKLQEPIETEKLIAAAKGQSALAAQVYAASLLAIEVDSQEEKNYLSQLAAGLELTPQITDRFHERLVDDLGLDIHPSEGLDDSSQDLIDVGHILFAILNNRF